MKNFFKGHKYTKKWHLYSDYIALLFSSFSADKPVAVPVPCTVTSVPQEPAGIKLPFVSKVSLG